MDKYEISLWEDYQDSTVVDNQTVTFLNERKLCVIGADTMTSQARVLEPKLIENINGTHTFTFKMFMKYTDNETGEVYDNPFLHLLINERKVKVYWKDTWYDLVIKRCQEDSSGKSIVYTCTDLFINELSKNGFELNFATDLENNIGTVEDLATTTLDGTTWAYDSSSDQIYQKNEEPVYEVTTTTDSSFSAFLQRGGEEDTDVTIGASSNILVFYSSVSKILDKYKQLLEEYPYEETSNTNLNNSITITSQPVNFVGRVGMDAYFNVVVSNQENVTYQWQVNTGQGWANSGSSGNKTSKLKVPISTVRYSYNYRCIIISGQDTITTRTVRMINDSYETQFLYAEQYEVDANNLLVTNGNCYLCKDIMCELDENINVLTIKKDNNIIFTVPIGQGVSENYRAERLVKSPLTEFDNVVNRYVTVCSNKDDSIQVFSSSSNYDIGDRVAYPSTPSQGGEIYEFVKAHTSGVWNESEVLLDKVYLIENTEYTDPLAVVNLIANPTQYKNMNGWLPTNDEDIKWRIWPEFKSDTSLSSYSAKSYLKLYGTIYNTGLTSNISYLTPTNSGIRNGNIGGFQIGEKYIFRAKVVEDNDGHPSDTYYNGNIGTCSVKRIDPNNKPQPIGDSYFISNGPTINDNWIEYTLICNTSCSVNDIENLGLYLTLNNTYWFEDIQFFKYTEGKASYEQGVQPQRMNPGEINLQSIVVKTYKYYYANHPNIKDANQLTYIYIGEQESDKYPIQYNKYEKLATINIKESNRFNILQTIAETFKCWVKFRIEHKPNGKIIFKNGVPQKFVTFNAEVGDDKKKLAFEYGIDLKSISRIVDSNSIATKVIVLENSNEFAQDGFCTITRSNENYSKSNFILNFDYYVQQGLLSKDQIQRDLYGTSENDIGYYYYLRWYNRNYDGYNSELITKKMDQLKQQSQLTTYNQYLISAKEKKVNIEDDICKLANVKSINDANAYLQDHKNNTKVQTLVNSYAEVNNQINNYNSLIAGANNTLNNLNFHISQLNVNINEVLNNIKELNIKFNTKYGTYIQEGTWQDESYTNDDEYYFSATSVSYTSSRPQITYSISVLRLSGLEEFSSKVFKVGDICYMIDREYFGYSDLKTKTPYKEKILVSEITSNFDSPEKDTIQVRNYKTRFDDLFQRIAAATQSLQYSEGEYSRAANVINTNRTLNFATLQDTFDENSNLILNSSNQDVVWDDTGITITNKLDSADKTKIIAGGIFVTNDGGETWKNAVRGDGISTELLTAGRINTSQIYIYDGNHESFRWDSDGLTAYWHDESNTNFGKFVRHDRFGLYGYQDNTQSEYINDFIPNSEDEIWNNENTKFALTWKGFLLNSSNDDGYLRLTSKPVQWFGGNDYDSLTIYNKTDLFFNGDKELLKTESITHSCNNAYWTGYKKFNNTINYSANDLIFYNGMRYKFKQAHTAGDWDRNEVEEVNISEFVETKDYEINDIVLYNNKYYIFNQVHSGPWDGPQASDAKEIIIESFSNYKDYNIGNIVKYTRCYKFNKSHQGPWDDNDVDVFIIPCFSFNKEYNKNDIVIYGDKFYQFNQDHKFPKNEHYTPYIEPPYWEDKKTFSNLWWKETEVSEINISNFNENTSYEEGALVMHERYYKFIRSKQKNNFNSTNHESSYCPVYNEYDFYYGGDIVQYNNSYYILTDYQGGGYIGEGLPFDYSEAILIDIEKYLFNNDRFYFENDTVSESNTFSYFINNIIPWDNTIVDSISFNHFDVNTNYSSGDIVLKVQDNENKYYEFIKNHPAGPWIDDYSFDINEVIIENYDATKIYYKDDIVIHQVSNKNRYYKFIKNKQAGSWQNTVSGKNIVERIYTEDDIDFDINNDYAINDIVKYSNNKFYVFTKPHTSGHDLIIPDIYEIVFPTSDSMLIYGGSRKNIETPNFYITKDGNAYFKGHISSSSGDIGGWYITANNLYSKSGSVFLNGASKDINTNPYGDYAIWAGNNIPEDSPFYLTKDGVLKATEIQGSRFRNSGLGMILQGDDFWGGSFTINHASGILNPAFQVRWVPGVNGYYYAYIYLLGMNIIRFKINTNNGKWNCYYDQGEQWID